MDGVHRLSINLHVLEHFRNRWPRNAGLRLDHFLLSPDVAARLKSGGVDCSVRGYEGASDHAPVWIKLQGQDAVVETKPSARKNIFVPLEFFNPAAAKVARDLVGKRFVRSLGSATLSFTITETEAYEGEHDLACNSSKGRTARTELMFGPAGRFYIYRVYGLHWMLNIVTGEVNDAAAVLVRGVEGVNGPGRVAAELGIDSSLTGLEAVPASGLWFEEPDATRRFRVTRAARFGVDYAGPIWAAKKLRFVMA